MARALIAIVGVAFALGFLCVPLVAPHSPNAWWVASACAGVCLLVSVAGWGRRGSVAACWVLAGLVGALSIVALHDKLTEPDPRPFAEHWGWPWGWLRAVALALIFAWSVYAGERQRQRLARLNLIPSWWSTMEVDIEIVEAREPCAAIAQIREYESDADAEELIRRFREEHGIESPRSVALEEARAFAVEMLRWDQVDGKEAMDEDSARGWTDEFLNEAFAGRPFLRAWVGKTSARAGVAVEGEGFGAVLAVDDTRWEDEGEPGVAFEGDGRANSPL